MKFFDRGASKRHWWNRNWFFTGTILLILVQIIPFAIFGAGWSTQLFDKNADYHSFSIQNFFNGIFGSFDHANWQHISLNMLCFFFCGLYLERKQGTCLWVPFVLVLSTFSRMANMLILQNSHWGGMYPVGFSSCNYALYGYILSDILFRCRELAKSKFEIAWSLLFLCLIYFASCFCGGTTAIGFAWYPYDFINNSWHWSGFWVGVIFFMLLYVYRFAVKNES